ncbi:hypothetical protein OCF10_13455 [Bacillus cereus]|nr:hypothetical protein [Bacillus cereus]
MGRTESIVETKELVTKQDGIEIAVLILNWEILKNIDIINNNLSKCCS